MTSLNERLTPEVRHRIRELAEGVLRDAGVRGVELPTPIVRVQEAAGLTHRRDLRDVPAGVFDDYIPGDREVLGLLAYDIATVYVNMALSPGRLLFTDAHELGHWVCEGHREAALLRWDTGRTLAGPSRAADGTLPVWYTVESPSYYRRFGALGSVLPLGGEGLRMEALNGLLHHASARLNQPQTRPNVRVSDGTRAGEAFTCDAVFNGYAHLLLVTSATAYRPYASFALRSAARTVGGLAIVAGEEPSPDFGL